MKVYVIYFVENAGHAVLYSYGHFLDSLLINFYHLNRTFSNINVHSNSISIQVSVELIFMINNNFYIFGYMWCFILGDSRRSLLYVRVNQY